MQGKSRIVRPQNVKADAKAGESTTLCRDLPSINVSSDSMRIDKKKGERGLAAFNRWSKEEADGWCSIGLCSSGTCRGQRSNLSVNLIKETDAFIEVKFSFTISCKCETTA